MHGNRLNILSDSKEVLKKIIPVLFGFMKDWMGSQNAYWICLPFYLLIMYYAYYGYKIRK